MSAICAQFAHKAGRVKGNFELCMGVQMKKEYNHIKYIIMW